MFGDSITITLGGSGGVARALKKINQDNFSAEYLDRSTGTDEVRLVIRHTKETAKNGVAPLDRHNFVLTQTVFATLTEAEKVRQFYFVYRHMPADVVSEVVDLGEAATFWSTAANLEKVLGWES